MPRIIEGEADVKEVTIGIVVAKYNESITSKLLQGAIDTLLESGVQDQNIEVMYVPGAFEISITASFMAHSMLYDAVICLGAVIRGETSHDQHINRSVSLAITDISLETGIPVMFGVLTVNSLEQAIHRAGGQHGNKGSECAEAALEMVNAFEGIEQRVLSARESGELKPLPIEEQE